DCVRVDPQRAERLSPRPEGRRPFGLDAAPPRDGHPFSQRHPRQLLGDSGLSRAGFALAEDEAAGPPAGGLERGMESFELTPPSYEPAGFRRCWVNAKRRTSV